ncbi:MAG: GNAT family N-acetyltransferase [Promethearchaeota archaeon]
MDYESRALEESDRDAILEIARTTWEGHDHLPKMFDEWIAYSECHPLAITSEERVVALGCVRVIEEGKTAWLEGLRVHKDFRGRGLARKITELLRDLAVELGARRARLTTAIDNPIPQRLAESIGMSCVALLDIIWTTNRRRRKPPDESVTVDQCSVEEFVGYAQGQNGLVPGNVITYFWYALDATEYAVTKLKEITGIQCLAAWKDSDLVGLSIGYPRGPEDNREWSTTIYPSSKDTLLSLLYHQMPHCVESGISTLMLQYPAKFTEYVKDNVLWRRARHSLTLGLFEGLL